MGGDLVYTCSRIWVQPRTYAIYSNICVACTRALISGPASPPQQPPRAPRSGPGRTAGGDFFAICEQIYARKPSNKVRLNASRTSKRRVSCLGMSWRRNELITLTLPKSGVARTASMLRWLFCSAYGECQNVPTNKQLRRIPKSAFWFVYGYDE